MRGIKNDKVHRVEKQIVVPNAAEPGAQVEPDESEPDVQALRRVQGLVDSEGPRAGVGAAQIVHGLNVIEGKRSKMSAAITGMLLALSLTVGFTSSAHAQDTTQPSSAVPTMFLPFKTGPPKTTVFNARLDAMQDADKERSARAALDRFGVAMEHALLLDAEGLARGGPHDPNAPLSAQQRKDVERALSDLLREMPVSALAPHLSEALESLLREHGVHVDGFQNKSLRELGDAGRDIVKQMVKEMRNERPAVFYGVAAGVATAVGVVAYTQGTDAIGVKPQLKTRFFNDELVAKLRVEWGPKLVDPVVTARIEHPGRFTFGGATLATNVGVGVVGGGATFKEIEARGFELSGSLSGVLESGAHVASSTSIVLHGDGSLNAVTVSGSYVHEPWTASASGSYFSNEDRYVGQLSVGYRPRKNVDWALVGTHDSHGESYVGIGLRMSF